LRGFGGLGKGKEELEVMRKSYLSMGKCRGEDLARRYDTSCHDFLEGFIVPCSSCEYEVDVIWWTLDTGYPRQG